VSVAAPIAVHEEAVRAEWIDRNGHMNLAYYVVICDHATDGVFDALGIGAAYTAATGDSLFAVESHILYERELRAEERVRVVSRVLGADAKRLHLAHEMLRPDGRERAAMQEVLLIHVDLAARRAVPLPPDRRAVIAEALAAEARLPRPAGLGRRIALGG
jgi:acyl-CoA thioester hydrolase